jgi:hypothetical protein
MVLMTTSNIKEVFIHQSATSLLLRRIVCLISSMQGILQCDNKRFNG